MSPMLETGWFSFNAFAFASLAFVHLRYPSKVRRVVGHLAAIFGTSKYMAAYPETHFRMAGGIYAVCAVAMGLGAVLSATGSW